MLQDQLCKRNNAAVLPVVSQMITCIDALGGGVDESTTVLAFDINETKDCGGVAGRESVPDDHLECTILYGVHSGKWLRSRVC